MLKMYHASIIRINSFCSYLVKNDHFYLIGNEIFFLNLFQLSISLFDSSLYRRLLANNFDLKLRARRIFVIVKVTINVELDDRIILINYS